jgi:hypothetical protein
MHGAGSHELILEWWFPLLVEMMELGNWRAASRRDVRPARRTAGDVEDFSNLCFRGPSRIIGNLEQSFDANQVDLAACEQYNRTEGTGEQCNNSSFLPYIYSFISFISITSREHILYENQPVHANYGNSNLDLRSPSNG